MSMKDSVFGRIDARIEYASDRYGPFSSTHEAHV
jgi:hypothetical protein